MRWWQQHAVVNAWVASTALQSGPLTLLTQRPQCEQHHYQVHNHIG
jgi:hypothetical protein